MQVYFSATRSIQPQRLGRPVVAPNSCPIFLNSSPVASNNSVGKGPLPTRVQYAFVTPITSLICWGAIPSPVHTPAEIVFDEVTNGKVPKSTSSMLPWAPSARTFLPSRIFSFIKYSPFTILNWRMKSIASRNSSSHAEMSSVKFRLSSNFWCLILSLMYCEVKLLSRISPTRMPFLPVLSM